MINVFIFSSLFLINYVQDEHTDTHCGLCVGLHDSDTLSLASLDKKKETFLCAHVEKQSVPHGSE